MSVEHHVTQLQYVDNHAESFYYRMFMELLHSHLANAADRCTTSRDDVRFYQGMVHAFNTVKGKNDTDMKGFHKQIRERVETGVAEQSVPGTAKV